MRDIEVKVIAEHGSPAAMMSFLARLTQRGANISCMADLEELMEKPASKGLVESMVAMEHHKTIRRFAPITVAIVGASRRFLAQIRTHSVGLNFVSASLQYSDYTGKARFVVPYALLEADEVAQQAREIPTVLPSELYLNSCEDSMQVYKLLANATDNDTAGYVAPQGLRNILIIQGNHDAWMNMITLRSCNRNTVETQYVVMRIWEELLRTEDGPEMLKWAGPDCMYGACKEGKMCCGVSLRPHMRAANEQAISIPRYIIDKKWPLLRR